MIFLKTRRRRVGERGVSWEVRMLGEEGRGGGGSALALALARLGSRAAAVTQMYVVSDDSFLAHS
jgi:sugar/nucleoside kinase (ribokinase family)